MTLKLFYIFCLSILISTITSPTLAQCYQRISLVGGVSVCVIPKTIVDKSLTDFQIPITNIQFQKNGNLISIHALEIDSNKALSSFSNNTHPNLLIQYCRDYYLPIDSTCIAFDTIGIGKINTKYPFVDILQTNQFFNHYSNCVGGLLNYSSIKTHFIIINKYLYIFTVQAVNACQKENGAKKTQKAVQVDFKKLINSIKINTVV